MTVLCHPDLRRVGERCVLHELVLGMRVGISRAAPNFQPVQAGAPRPLEDPFLTRKPIWLASEGKRIIIDCGEVSAGVRIDGQAASGRITLEHARLETGVLLELAERVLLSLHWGQPGPFQPSHGLVGASEGMRRMHSEIADAAAHDLPVLVLGETGSGKELVSRAVHDSSARAKGPYVAVSLATIPAHLAEDELFGHVQGAFSGASHARPGLFRQAHGGTLFLDEVGEASNELQAKLLRVTELHELRPLGANAPVHVDVRLVAATDADLQAQQASGRFKSPLWHRLAATVICIPPLRARPDDIARLWVHFMAEALGGDADAALGEREEDPLVGTALMTLLMNHEWPGNVRQLRHLATHYALHAARSGTDAAQRVLMARLRGETMPSAPAAIEAEDTAPAQPEPAEAAPVSAAKIDDATLVAALRDNRWRIMATARQLGISKNALYRLIEQSSTLRKGSDIPREEVLATLARCAGDIEQTAAELQISERALRIRMTDLGLS